MPSATCLTVECMTADRRSDLSGRGSVTGGHRLPPARSSYISDSTAALPVAQEMLGPYRLLGKLGEGGMGVVYKGMDPAGEIVAVKVLRPHIAHDPSARERLRREVSTLVRVRSRYVAAFLDADVDGERPYIVTSFVPGAALDDVVEDAGRFGAPRLARLGHGLAEALSAIHAAGIVHRDLKPGNVLMVGDDPVLIDFGIAHVADDARLTSTGLVMGTPGYLSPEIVEGEEVTQATDWWGWAATLAYAASGEPPFGRGPMPVILDRVTRGQSDLRGVDERIRPLLRAALTPDPAARPTAAEVLSELEVYAGGGHTGHIPVRSSRPATQVIGAALPSAPPVHAQPPSAYPTEQLAVDRGRNAGYGPSGRPNPLGDVDRPVPSMPPGRYAPPADPRIGQPTRTGTLAALLAVAVGLSALWPIVGCIAVIAWAVIARWCDRTVTSMVVRRFHQGPRKSDTFVATVVSPWHGVVAFLATVLTVLIPAFVGACAAAAVALAVSMSRGSQTSIDRPAPVAAGMVIAILVMWWGPGATSLRRGSRSVVRGVVRGEPLTRIMVGMMIAIAALCGLWALTHLTSSVNWWPLDIHSGMSINSFLPSLPGR